MATKAEELLFFDIETAPVTASYGELSEEMQELWNERNLQLHLSNTEKYPENPVEGYKNASLYAEFGRVVCISVGYIKDLKDSLELKDGSYLKNSSELNGNPNVKNGCSAKDDKCIHIKSFCKENEKELLEEFVAMLNGFVGRDKKLKMLCGHNIKGFDVPFLCRRMLICGVQLPKVLDVAEMKPWDMPFVDTLEMWRFGDMRNFTKLKVLTAVFGIKSPKDDIDGSYVGEVFHQQHDLQRIQTYCQKDVVATIQVYLSMKHEATIDENNVCYK